MMDPAAAQDAASDHPRALSVNIVQQSDVGLVRSENQDFAIVNTVEEASGNREKGRLMVVADGMGGHRGGATASKMAATVVKAEYLSSAMTNPGEALKAALEKANAMIFAEASTNPELRGMGTTCSCLAVIGNTAFVAHVGDSRIYLLRGGEIRQITEDHSLVASMVREGLLSAKEAETHPRRNVLQRSMGVSEQVEVDTLSLEVQVGDKFILCSDGLHGVVKLDELGEVAGGPPAEAAKEFVRRTLDRGAPDNITVVIAEIGAEQNEVGVARAAPATDPAPDLSAITVPISIGDETIPVGFLARPPVVDVLPEAVPKSEVLADDEPVVDHSSAPAPSETATRASAGTLVTWVLIVLLAIGAGAALYFWSGWTPQATESGRGR